MASKTLTGWTNKFLQKINTLTSQDKTEARTLIDAASHTDTVAALAAKQPLDADLTAYADAADAAARRTLIGAASTVSPNFTSPTCSTPAAGNDSALIANTAFVQREIQSGGGLASCPNLDPNIPHVITIEAGETAYTLTRTTDADGLPRWTNGSNSVRYYLELPIDTANPGYQINIPGIFVAELAYAVTPWDAGTWVISVGALLGQPSVNAESVIARYDNEVIRATGTDPDTFWKWDGSAWVDITI